MMVEIIGGECDMQTALILLSQQKEIDELKKKKKNRDDTDGKI